MSAEEAQKYGLIDKVLTRQELASQREALVG
jgi:ATP-dependent protease ClpP protease subunit